jgi:hypothetical protein
MAPRGRNFPLFLHHFVLEVLETERKKMKEDDTKCSCSTGVTVDSSTVGVLGTGHEAAAAALEKVVTMAGPTKVVVTLCVIKFLVVSLLRSQLVEVHLGAAAMLDVLTLEIFQRF